MATAAASGSQLDLDSQTGSGYARVVYFHPNEPEARA
jgi:hypothetical protein